jgi:hypothetical protein
MNLDILKSLRPNVAAYCESNSDRFNAYLWIALNDRQFDEHPKSTIWSHKGGNTYTLVLENNKRSQIVPNYIRDSGAALRAVYEYFPHSITSVNTVRGKFLYQSRLTTGMVLLFTSRIHLNFRQELSWKRF